MLWPPDGGSLGRAMSSQTEGRKCCIGGRVRMALAPAAIGCQPLGSRPTGQPIHAVERMRMGWAPCGLGPGDSLVKNRGLIGLWANTLPIAEVTETGGGISPTMQGQEREPEETLGRAHIPADTKCAIPETVEGHKGVE